MNDARISQLNPAGPLSGAEYMPLTQVDPITQQLYTLYTNPEAIKTYILNTIGDKLIPAGSIMTYGGTASGAEVVPGWLLCDGSLVLRSTYATLFSRIGTTYGSTDASNFRLPNLKGRVIMGYCNTTSTQSFSSIAGANWPATTTVAVGDVGGEFYHQLSTSELPAHSHAVTDPGHKHMFGADDLWPQQAAFISRGITPVPNSNLGYDARSNAQNAYANLWYTTSAATNISIGNAGGGMTHNTMQPYMALNYIIKY